MKTQLLIALMSFASLASAADCVTDARGRKVCSNGDKAVAVNPNTGKVTTAERNGGSRTVQSNSNTQAAVNSRTGNAAVAQTNQNGVTTTKTARGGEAKTRNGVGVVEGPDGTVCAKGKNNQGCKKK